MKASGTRVRVSDGALVSCRLHPDAFRMHCLFLLKIFGNKYFHQFDSKKHLDTPAVQTIVDDYQLLMGTKDLPGFDS